ncbi:MAG: response regulator [Candidatus Eisenbacteria bacterium]|uniref:Response regulator n=1 Tax=Eiseniibacteriota bacterium TaxID=2212470 RepID=A0A849SUK8_UNCEI|nr:response regulator [Candidatus Eisenbacteria bacterium]
MKRVIVIEDDPVNARMMKALLERRGGWSVLHTESGDELFDLARRGEVALALLDVSLGSTSWNGRPVTGLELSRALKSDAATRAIPVVITSAHAMRGDAERFLRDSLAEDYVAKPITDHAAFVARLRNWLGEAA